MSGKEVRYRLDDLRRPQHADVDCRDIEILSEFFKGIGNEGRVDGLDPLYPRGGLHGHGCDASNAVACMGGDSLNVGGDASSGRGIESRNGGNNRWNFWPGT